MQKNPLSNLPEPTLRRAKKMIQAALEEKESRKSNNPEGLSGISAKDPRVKYETYKLPVLDFKTIIDWATRNKPSDIDCCASVLREYLNKEEFPTRFVVVYTRNNQIVGTCGCIFYAKRVDSALTETFGNADIIELN